MSHSTQNPDSKLIENETETHFFFEFPCMLKIYLKFIKKFAKKTTFLCLILFL